MKSKSSGKLFENKIENIFYLSKKFSDSIVRYPFINVFFYKELMNMYSSLDFETIIKRNKHDVLLIKNFPIGNNLHEKIEFCIIQKTNDVNIIKCKIECKYQKVNGSTHKKLEHEFTEHTKSNFNNPNPSYFILIYDGKYYENKQFIIDEKRKDIDSDHTALLLNVEEFKNFLFDFLKDMNFSRAFKVCKI